MRFFVLVDSEGHATAYDSDYGIREVMTSLCDSGISTMLLEIKFAEDSNFAITGFYTIRCTSKELIQDRKEFLKIIGKPLREAKQALENHKMDRISLAWGNRFSILFFAKSFSWRTRIKCFFTGKLFV